MGQLGPHVESQLLGASQDLNPALYYGFQPALIQSRKQGKYIKSIIKLN